MNHARRKGEAATDGAAAFSGLGTEPPQAPGLNISHAIAVELELTAGLEIPVGDHGSHSHALGQSPFALQEQRTLQGAALHRIRQFVAAAVWCIQVLVEEGQSEVLLTTCGNALIGEASDRKLGLSSGSAGTRPHRSGREQQNQHHTEELSHEKQKSSIRLYCSQE